MQDNIKDLDNKIITNCNNTTNHSNKANSKSHPNNKSAKTLLNDNNKDLDNPTQSNAKNIKSKERNSTKSKVSIIKSNNTKSQHKPHSQTTNLDIIKQLFESLSDKDKQHFIKSLDSATSKQKVAKTIIESNIESKVTMCPYCHSTHFVKNGTKANTYGQKRNIQNYLCRDCHKSFGDTSNTILFSTKKHISVWETYIHCLVEKYSLRKTAKICNISLNTAFIWRHKILDSLQSIMNKVELNGIIEADETFLRLSFKGNHKNFKLPRQT